MQLHFGADTLAAALAPHFEGQAIGFASFA